MLVDTDGPVLGLRYGMTGRILVDDTAPIAALEYSSDRDDPAWDRFGLDFAGGGSLVIRDPRRLGGVELDPDESKLGPDAVVIVNKCDIAKTDQIIAQLAKASDWDFSAYFPVSARSGNGVLRPRC